jgi:hypothetical protein
VGSLFFNNVWADHRYNIRGYVLNAKQQGIDAIPVQAFAQGELIGSSKTTAEGYYSIQLHLHNSDYRRIVKLRAGSNEAELQVSFDVEDDTSARIHEANFVNGKIVEGSLGRFHIPTWGYAVGGLLLFLTTLIFFKRRRKSKIRIAKFDENETHPPSRQSEKTAPQEILSLCRNNHLFGK